MNGQLGWKPSELRAKAKDMRDIIDEMKRELTSLDQTCEKLKQDWKDDRASLVYVSKVEDKRNSTAQIIAKYEELANNLDVWANRIERNEDTIADAGGRL